MERVIAYFDGFNLYHGLKDSHWKRYYWLDVQKLAMNLLKPYQRLVYTKYFTSRVSASPATVKRQSVYIDALESLKELKTYFGKYETKRRKCRNCAFENEFRNEKMTDVNIATEILLDAFRDDYDTVFLISADSDLRAPIAALRERFPRKRVVVLFPPKRHSEDLKRVAHAWLTIGEGKIRKSLLPAAIRLPDGVILQRPPEWQ